MRAIVLAVLLTNCTTSAQSIANIVPAVAVAVAASAISVAQGGCVSACPVGTTCNGKTALCDPLPCRGACGVMTHCVQHSANDERCEMDGLSKAPPLATNQNREPASQPSNEFW